MLTGRTQGALAGRQGGFSLFELVVVLGIIAVVVAIAAPRYADSIARHRADLVARRIVADLDLARAKAYASSTTVTVKFDVQADTVWLVGMPSMDRAASEYVVRLAEPPYHARLVYADFGGSPALSFDGYGVASSGGCLVVQVGQVRRTLNLDPGTGKVVVQ
ncbi:MAG: hypothetical protein AMJ81_12895 [Phycisphaerae bacterium SM23_33]|nr:MAG: hypothetical protein AMJ81_12895 [Phycisphaerae bacterium SM23_33]